MEIGLRFGFSCGICYIIVFLLPGHSAKPFSLNKAIEEELASKKPYNSTNGKGLIKEAVTIKPKPFKNNIDQSHYTSKSKYKKAKFSDSIADFAENISKRTSKRKELKLSKFEAQQHGILFPIKNKKLYQIKTPLKPKTLNLRKPILPLKKASLKKETNSKDEIFKQYIPVLRRIGALFDNILASSTVDDLKHSSTNTDSTACPCEGNKTTTEKTTTASPISTRKPVQPKTKTKTSTKATNHFAPFHSINLRQNKNISLLPTRNTISGRRDNNGVSKGSSTTRHGGIKRDITRHYRDRQQFTRSERNNTNAELHAETTDSTPRNSTSSSGTNREDSAGGSSNYEIKTNENQGAANSDREIRRSIEKLEIKDQYQDFGDKNESTEFIRSGRTNNVSENKVSNITKPVQSQKHSEESIVSITNDISNDKRVFDRYGSFAEAIKTVRPKNNAITAIKRMDPSMMKFVPQDKAFVVIIDGYSMTSNKGLLSNNALKQIS